MIVTEFKNDVVAELRHQLGISQCVVTPYHSASYGLLERANRKILEALRHVTAGLEEASEEWLADVAASINGSYNSSIAETPQFVLFGDTHLHYDIFLQSTRLLYNPDDYAKLQFSVFQKIHRAVRSKLAVS